MTVQSLKSVKQQKWKETVYTDLEQTIPLQKDAEQQIKWAQRQTH